MKSFYPPAAPLAQTPAERILFSNGRVTVGDSRVEVDGQTFALIHLKSARMQRIPPKRRITATMIGVGLGGGISCSMALWLQLQGAFLNSGQLLAIAAVSFFIAAVGAILMIASKTTYGLIVATPSGEVRLLTGERAGEIAQYVAAVNHAISLRPVRGA